MPSNTFISGFLSAGHLPLSFISDMDKKLLSFKKVEKMLFKVLLYFFNTIILIKAILFLASDSLTIHYTESNSCWYSFGTSAFAGSTTQLPGLLLHPVTCTLLKPGQVVIEFFIAAIILAGIIVLFFINKYSSQKPAIEKKALNFKLMKNIIGANSGIKREQKDMKAFASTDNDMLPEILRISDNSRFCWIDMYGENLYGPISWDESHEEPENEKDIVKKTESN